MSTQEFGRMVDQAMREQGLSLRRLGNRIGELPDGRIVDATTLKRVIEGRRRSVDAQLGWALISELHLDPVVAAEAAGIWPPGVTIDMIRKLELAATTSALSHRLGSSQGQVKGLGQLIRFPVRPAATPLQLVASQ